VAQDKDRSISICVGRLIHPVVSHGVGGCMADQFRLDKRVASPFVARQGQGPLGRILTPGAGTVAVLRI